jgi:hypothetical protein
VRERVMWRGECARVLREERGVEWCAEERSGRAPFIASERGQRGTGRSSASMVLQRWRDVSEGR